MSYFGRQDYLEIEQHPLPDYELHEVAPENGDFTPIGPVGFANRRRAQDGAHPVSSEYSQLAIANEDTTWQEHTTSLSKHTTSPRSVLYRLQRRHLLTAWRLVLGSGALAGTVILLINFVVLVVIYARFDIVDHTASIWTGSCTASSNATTGIHLLINILSTVLLASSNFSMQCLSSPTRAEVDIAHSKRVWLSIGTPNVRNLLYIAPTKTLLWLVLGLSSLPLHLLWNSAVFETLATNEYVAISATPAFLTGSFWHLDNYPGDLSDATVRLQTLAQQTKLERLENADCIRAYSPEFQQQRRNLVMIVDPPSTTTISTSSVIAAYHEDFEVSGTTTSSWMCGDNTDPTQSLGSDGGVWACSSAWLERFAKTNASSWLPGNSTDLMYQSFGVWGDQDDHIINYCLSETRAAQCRVNVIPLFLAIVIICNALKVVGFVWTLHITQKCPPLITTGDAVHSFLQLPDPATRRRCLVSKGGYETLIFKSKEWDARPANTGDTWRGRRQRWGKAVRARQWWLFFLFASTCIIIAGAFFGPDGVGYGTTETWGMVLSFGIGKPVVNYNMSITSMPILTAFLGANIPQIVLSYLYLALNNIMTTMLAMAEWTSYASGTAKGLRVSSPVKGSEQRSTYRLSVPFRWAIPSTTLFMLLHWLFSQMLFIASIEVYDVNGDYSTERSLTTQYFSPLAMLIAVPLASAALVLVIGLAIFKRYPADSTLAGCCSASISAACQPGIRQEHDEGLSLRKLKWGVTDLPRLSGEVGHATISDGLVARLRRKLGWGVTEISGSVSGIGHASFSDGAVGGLLKGSLYA